VSEIKSIQYSVATNVSYVAPEELIPNGHNPPVSDPNVIEIVSNQIPTTPMSLLLTQDGVEKICGRTMNYTTYSKAFNSSFSNFRCEGIPVALGNCTTNNIKAIGLLGYSTAANILRRTSKNEPFSTRPVAHYLQSTTNSSKDKYKRLIEKQLSDLEGGVTNMVQTGTSYRLEVTFEIVTNNWELIQQEMDEKLSILREKAKDLLYQNGILVTTEVFPKAILVFGTEIYKHIKETIQKYEVSPEKVTIREKEFVVMLENLVKYVKLDSFLYKWKSKEYLTYIILINKNTSEFIQAQFSIL
jgi:hypothetical protein